MKGWDAVGDWYDGIVGDQGHYYHEHVILPKILAHIKAQKPKSILDLACGQGVLERQIAPDTPYTGVDIAPSLIKKAKERASSKKHQFFTADVTQELKLPSKDYSLATLILAAQDIEDIPTLFQNTASHLAPNGHFLIVMNHPCFRIPRQSSWSVDPATKQQQRKITRYLTPLSIPIQTRPSQDQKQTQVTYHHRPLSYYVNALNQAGFAISHLQELISDKTSTGANARMENRAREEFPLFLLLIAHLQSFSSS